MYLICCPYLHCYRCFWSKHFQRGKFIYCRRSRECWESKITKGEDLKQLCCNANSFEKDERLHCENWKVRFIQCCKHTWRLQKEEDWIKTKELVSVELYGKSLFNETEIVLKRKICRMFCKECKFGIIQCVVFKSAM